MSFKSDIQDKAIEVTLASAGTKSMWGGTATSVVGYLSTSGAAVLIGVVITILGFAFSIHFQRKAHHRQTEEWLTKKNYMEMEEERKKEIHELTLKQLRRDSINYEFDQEC